MKATLIAHHEKSFKDTGIDTLGRKHVFKPSSVPISGEEKNLIYTQCKLENNNETFYYKEEYPKEKIVLHFTAGYLKGDIGALTRENNHVSVPFVIGRSGEIFSLWTSKYWSYHLGSGSIGGNTNMSQKAIAIELSNIGYLKKIDDHLVTSYSDTDEYCKLSEEEYYTRVEESFRGQEYFATFTNEQYESLILLLRYLTARYQIPRNFLAPDKRFQLMNKEDVTSFRGILSHINFRSSGKWDIGPAFDWQRIIDGLALTKA